MNLISKIFTSKDSRLKKAIEINNRINEIKKETSRIRQDYAEIKKSNDTKMSILDGRLTICKSEAEKDINKDLKIKIENRFRNYDIDFEKSIIEKTKEVYLLKGKLNNLLKEKEINELFKKELEKSEKEQAFNVIQQAYSEDKISKDKFKQYRKKAEKQLQNKVKYADMIVMNKDGQILLLKRTADSDMFPNEWCLPGGHVDPNEDCKKAAIRETNEETTLEVSQFPIDQVNEIDNDKVNIKYYQVLLPYQEVTPIVGIDRNEHEDYEWVEIDDLHKYSLIADLKTVLDEIFVREVETLKSEKNDIEKSHKYIRKTSDGKGGWNYIYKEGEEKSLKVDQISNEQRQKNFKEWFGDSKVVDENGKPLVVYHGTNSDFKEFDSGKQKDRFNSHPTRSLGFFFTSNKDIATTFAQGVLGKYEEGGYQKGANILPTYVKIENPKNITGEDFLKIKDENYAKKLKSDLIKEGFDGIIVGKIESKTSDLRDFQYIAFQSNQIKSATGNNGNFDPKSNDITKAIETIISALEEGKIEYDNIEKAHKYIKRVGTPGHYTYTYYEDEKKGVMYINSPAYVSLSTYKEKVEPLIKQFLEENKDVLKSMDIDFGIESTNKIMDSLSIIKSAYEQGKVSKEILDQSFEKAFYGGLIDQEMFEKGRTGIYQDNSENRRLKRVGAKYGTKNEPDVLANKQGKKEDPENNKGTEKTVEEHAKEATDKALEGASKGGDEELRIAAKKELERRENEHKPEESEEKTEIKESEDVSGDKKEIAPTKQDILRDYSENFLKTNIPKDTDFCFSGYSDTNGQSMYFKVFKKGDELNSIKVRFSDHNVTNQDRMSNEVHFGIKKRMDEESNVNKIGYLLGLDGYVYKQAPLKRQVEVSESNIRGRKVIDEYMPQQNPNSNIKPSKKYIVEDILQSVWQYMKDSSNDRKEEPKQKGDLNTKEGIESEIKRLRDIDTDNIDEISKISEDIQSLLEKRKNIGDKISSERKVSFEEYRKGFKDFTIPTNTDENELTKDIDKQINDLYTELKKPENKGNADIMDKINSLNKDKISLIDNTDAFIANKNKELADFYKDSSSKIKINDEEKKAIDDYTSNYYRNIRQYLSDIETYTKETKGRVRNIDDNIKIMKGKVESISSFIGKNKIKESISLNRNVKHDGVAFFKGLKEGEVYVDKSFSSTSLVEQKLFGDFNIEILAKKGSNVANIANEKEYEYLIDKGSKFRVLKSSDTGIIVELL